MYRLEQSLSFVENRQQCSLCRTSQYDAYLPYTGRDYGNYNPAVNIIEADIAQTFGRSGQNDTGLQEQSHEPFKDYMDPKLMMLRLDVQQVINNLDQTRRIEDRNDQEQ
ncbi:uncharacterized protein LOC133319118 [Danaus plexippus]|uniref:uncharacterized protein LOC133319118 n=1 Tax=Danaus plexippus TaxID=13037 RepID=UPI002AB00D38|nr:uncharacterized protein LOC133319118 [Danaus plexippus]